MNQTSEQEAHDYVIRAFTVFYSGGMHGEADRLKVVDEAVGYLFMAVDNLENPEMQALAFGFLAQCLLLLGNKDHAQEWVNRTLAIDPDNINANVTNFDLKAGKLDKMLNGVQTAANMTPLGGLFVLSRELTKKIGLPGSESAEVKKYALAVLKAYQNTVAKEPNQLSFIYWIGGARAVLWISDFLKNHFYVSDPSFSRAVQQTSWEKLYQLSISDEDRKDMAADIEAININANKILRLMGVR